MARKQKEGELSDVVGNWDRAHPGEREKYRGEWIAVHKEKGLLAALILQITNDSMREEVVLDRVEEFY